MCSSLLYLDPGGSMKTEPRGWGAFALADRHRTALFVEKESIRQQSGWFLRTAAWETKHRLGYHLYNDSDHADWLVDRLTNLRGGSARATISTALMEAVSRNVDAPSATSFIRGLYLVIKPELLVFYRATLEGADPAANAFDRRMIGRIIPELEEQIEWASQLLADDTAEKSIIWANGIASLLAAAGGLEGRMAPPESNRAPASPAASHGVAARTATSAPSVNMPFVLPSSIVFDDRIGEEPIMPHDRKMELAFDEAVVEQFRVFFNEIYAASILASILYQAFDQDVPWAMIRWFTRHFWDEVRHSQFGAVRLVELGSAPDRCDQTLYRNSQQMPFLHRICYLTLVLEKHYMPRKKPRFELYGNEGDQRSQLFADHDWSDEMNHVRNGRDWLENLLEDDARGVADIEDETMAHLERITGGATASVSPF